MADKVVQRLSTTGSPSATPPPPAGTVTENTLRRKPIFESNAEPKDEKLQFKAAGGDPPAVTPGVESRLHSSKGGGSPLSGETRGKMESSFGADFSSVRIHNDSSAAEMSSKLNAQAFTHGSDIYFGRGKFDVDSNSGQRLLAHELTHTIQQRQSSLVQREDRKSVV